jgi:cytochrome c oxidase subunit 2
VSEDNPLGVNPDDPNSADDKIIDNGEVHLPVGRPVKALLRSKDVLHNFTVTEFRVKMDLVPGLVTYLWVEPTRTGRFDILCEELCGVGHFAMRGRMVVDEPADFDAWLASQPTFAETQDQLSGNAQAGAGSYAICSTCHGTRGEGNVALNGPKLAGQESWYLRRQIKAFKDGTRGAHQDDEFGRQMAPMVATLANDEAIENVIAYIGTLPDVPAAHTIEGDVDNGERLWATCGACHGKAAQGRQATNAPRQAGMSDWYLARQIANFKTGVRGKHDMYGKQMGIVSIMVKSEDDINDVVAYINTL